MAKAKREPMTALEHVCADYGDAYKEFLKENEDYPCEESAFFFLSELERELEGYSQSNRIEYE